MSLCALGVSGTMATPELCEHMVSKLLPCELCKLQNQIFVLGSQLSHLYERVVTIEERAIQPLKEAPYQRPHKCPLCEGSGKVWPGGTIGYEHCGVCKGKGLLWG